MCTRTVYLTLFSELTHWIYCGFQSGTSFEGDELSSKRLAEGKCVFIIQGGHGIQQGQGGGAVFSVMIHFDDLYLCHLRVPGKEPDSAWYSLSKPSIILN